MFRVVGIVKLYQIFNKKEIAHPPYLVIIKIFNEQYNFWNFIKSNSIDDMNFCFILRPMSKVFIYGVGLVP